ncbi:MAG: ROK family glucokinase [Actinomycetota bacterium]|nr:ROK family glucokinase [Nocardioidaceae bacterium]MDQ3481673.1 ROK family glucokinase [Actinomycetota bacterium]
MLQRLAIGIDIGGTKVAAGVVDEDGVVLERARRDTPSTSPTEVENAIAEIVSDLRSRHVVSAVGIGAAGFVDATRSTVLFAPHLAWRHEPLRDAVRRRIGLSTLVENDANAAAWAEWRFGAAQNEPNLLCVTLGTGIGGGLVLGGIVHRGGHGIAGEFGHMQVVRDGHRCECGNRGCWEQYASGNALVREARELARSRSPLAQALLDRAGGDPAAITGPLVTEVALSGDPASVELLGEVGDWLGVGLANLAAALDPGIFVIGGGVSDAGELLIGPATIAYRRTLTGRGFRPEVRIVRAHLGNEAGMIGAADLARSQARKSRRRSGSRSRSRSRRGELLTPKRGLGLSWQDQRSTRATSKEYGSGR